VKAKRQQAILSLVSRERLGTQEDIRARLAYMGLEATQSTISRDIDELGLARVHAHDGVRYVVPGEADAPAPLRLLRHLLDEFALSFVLAESGLVIRTPPGAAAALAEGIDRAPRSRQGPRQAALRAAGKCCGVVTCSLRHGKTRHRVEAILTVYRGARLRRAARIWM
jgi:transcriptional regulator of arginine metabolism